MSKESKNQGEKERFDINRFMGKVGKDIERSQNEELMKASKSMAQLIYTLYLSFQNQGFSEDRSFELVKTFFGQWAKNLTFMDSY